MQVGIPEGESLRTRTSAGFWPSAGSQRPTLPRSLGRGSPHGTRSSGDGRVRLENGEFEGASSCAVIANSLIRPHGLFHIGYHIISYRIVSYRLVSSLSLISLTGAWHFLIYLSLYPWFSFFGGDCFSRNPVSRLGQFLTWQHQAQILKSSSSRVPACAIF